MSFGGGWRPPGNWPMPNYDPASWRPYGSNDSSGPMRAMPRSGNVRNGWTSNMSDPYFSRNSLAQEHIAHYERNRMHFFNQFQGPAPIQQAGPAVQKPLRKPLLETPIMDEFVKQKLLQNAHVPGLRTGLQLRNVMQQRKNLREQQRTSTIATEGMNVKVSVTSEKLDLHWNNPVPTEQVKYVVNIQCVKNKSSSMMLKPSSTPHCTFDLVAGETYKVEVVCQRSRDDVMLRKWSKEIRAEFSYNELKHLLHKCYLFISRGKKSEPQMHQFCVAYRCKPKVYWDEIHHYYNDVMQKYIKDDNGQPGNLINGKINGLFFSARLLPDLSLPQYSPFGNVRMVINAFTLLNPNRHNFYFADFYCNKNIHYVTIALCVIDSETDRFCRDRLIKLNPLSNPFVKLVPPPDPFSQWKFYINYTVWVELYYTEDIQLNMGQFSAIMATGAGTSKIGGLPNNKRCNICNLYPLGSKVSSGKIPTERIETGPSNTDSTIAAILKEDEEVDTDIVEILCYLVDQVEESNLTTEELTAKLDKKLVEAVENLNKEVALPLERTPTVKENTMNQLATNLTDFVNSFNSRRDALLQDIMQLKRE